MPFWKRKNLSVLFVCTANICRSPLAHGMMKDKLKQAGLLDQVHVDSAGTHVNTARYRPDPRARQVAEQNGVNISRFKARQVRHKDFRQFDYILAMDTQNLTWLLEQCPEEYKPKVHRLLEIASSQKRLDVPDPYFGNQSGFEQVYGLLDPALTCFLVELERRLAEQESHR